MQYCTTIEKSLKLTSDSCTQHFFLELRVPKVNSSKRALAEISSDRQAKHLCLTFPASALYKLNWGASLNPRPQAFLRTDTSKEDEEEGKEDGEVVQSDVSDKRWLAPIFNGSFSKEFKVALIMRISRMTRRRGASLRPAVAGLDGRVTRPTYVPPVPRSPVFFVSLSSFVHFHFHLHRFGSFSDLLLFLAADEWRP